MGIETLMTKTIASPRAYPIMDPKVFSSVPGHIANFERPKFNQPEINWTDLVFKGRVVD